MQGSTIKSIAWWATLAVAAVVAWQAGKLTWFFWPEGDLVLLSDTGTKSFLSKQVRNNYPSWNLFGKPVRAEARPVENQPVTPKTKLRLRLMGVLVNVESNESGAIIAEKGRSEDYYKVNDRLPGNAVLVSVYEDHIILSRSGILEKLSFDEATADHKSNAFAVVEQRDSATKIDTPEKFMKMAQTRLSEEPRRALASVGLSPMRGSDPSGYVFNGRNPMLTAMNMQKGDVILSVNGHILGDLEQDKTKLQELYDSGMLEVEIERQGATFTISYPLN